MSRCDPKDLIPPQFKLLQATGGREAKTAGGRPGQFYHTLRGDVVDQINCCVVDIIKVRTKWGGEISDAPPECSSDDADSLLSRDGKDCRECLFRCDTPWSVEAQARRDLCTIGYVLLGVDIDQNDEPFVLRAHGVSVGAVRELLSALRFNRTLKGQYWQACVRLSSQEKHTKQGTVWALVARPSGLLPSDKIEELKDWIPELLGIPIAPALEAGNGGISLLPEGVEKEELEEEAPGYTLDY